MATLNVYLPDALKAEMDETAGINWSQVAQEAFRRAIQLERIRIVDLQEAKLERLRGSRLNAEERQEAEAEALGKAWALDHADYDELERVVDLDFEDIDEDTAGAAAGSLANAIFGRGEWTPGDAKEFFEQHLETVDPKAHQLRGFVRGASEVFAAI